jgi:type IV pilus assembly protein PilY1
MRRGGKGCYALDLSNPDDPKLMWTIDNTDTGFGEMAQTWSLLRAGLVAYEDSGGALVQTAGLFFGAGYNGDDGGDRYGDLGKDNRTGLVGTDDYEGNGVFVVDARDGSLIWKAVGPEDATDNGNGWSSATNTLEVPDMKDSIPGDIFLFDSDGDGITDRIYFADTGGILWRGDIVPGPRSVWTMTRMLNFGRHYSATNADDRRAFSRVDVAKARELEPGQLQVGDPFDAVVVTTGDRAHPTGTDVEDWVYMFKDKNIASGAPPLPPILDHDDLQDLTDNCLQDDNNSDCPDLVAGELPKLDNGWKVRLNHCGDAAISVGTDCGEKGLSRPLIINNTVFLTTYLPPAASGGMCELAQGKGLFYAMKLQNATAVFDFNVSNNNNGIVLDRFDELASPGIPPAPVALSAGTILRPDLVVEEVPPPSNGPTFWYETYLK